ncbi:hypothetical protein [Bradyrhizobium ivorense]|uniref:hypothetical protein n=1 Tax=Bradyrhizobium ivorense TaxID=2511166 RepID=UPI0010B2AA75|nr:hypothetical protein [Bradyrhizobium ivorense]VIO77362.1 hypothetical protein CI41S_56170 [Bradyrhizobium ivorense]
MAGYKVNKDGFEKVFSPFGPSPLDQAADKLADGSLIRDAYQTPFNESLLGQLVNYLAQLGVDQAVNRASNSSNPVGGAGQVFGDGPPVSNTPNLSPAPRRPLSSVGSSGSVSSAADRNFRYLARSTAGEPQSFRFDTDAPAVPFVQPGARNPSSGLPGEHAAELARGARRSLNGLAPARPIGLVSGEPMPDYLFRLPIWERSEGPGRLADNEDWLMRLLRVTRAD